MIARPLGRALGSRVPDITVISGAPCAGKSTYIAERAKPGDVIIDLDRLALALTTDGTSDHSYPDHVRHVAIGARRGAVHRALGTTVGSVWIIDTDPEYRDEGAYRYAGARFVTLDPGEDVCIARARDLRPQMVGVIRDWYASRGGAS